MCRSLSRVQPFATVWTVAREVPLSMGFSREEYCSVLPFPSPGAFPNPELNPCLLCFLHCRQILYPLRLWGIPQKKEDSVCKKEFQAVLILYVQAFFSTIMICFSLDFKYLWIEEELPRPVYSPFPSSTGFPGGSNHKESACNTGDLGLIPGSGRSPGEGKGNSL